MEILGISFSEGGRENSHSLRLLVWRRRRRGSDSTSPSSGSTVIFFVLFAFSSTGCLFRSCATLLDVANGFGAFFAVDFDLWVRACHRWFASDLFLPLSGESTCAILFPRCSRFRLVFSSLSIWICDVVDFLMWNGEPFFPFKSVRWPPSLWVFPHSFRVF